MNEARASSKDPLILIEERVDFSPYVPDGFGTRDIILIYGDRLEVIDLKGGKGVKVSAVENPQMRLYALGAINNFGVLYDTQKVKATCRARAEENLKLACMDFQKPLLLTLLLVYAIK